MNDKKQKFADLLGIDPTFRRKEDMDQALENIVREKYCKDAAYEAHDDTHLWRASVEICQPDLFRSAVDASGHQAEYHDGYQHHERTEESVHQACEIETSLKEIMIPCLGIIVAVRIVCIHCDHRRI